MDNEKLVKLLKTAREANRYRRQEIMMELNQACIANAEKNLLGEKQHTCSGCLLRILSDIYWGYLLKFPDELLTVLPVFMLLCGDLNQSDSLNKISQIDWKFFGQLMEEEKA